MDRRTWSTLAWVPLTIAIALGDAARAEGETNGSSVSSDTASAGTLATDSADLSHSTRRDEPAETDAVAEPEMVAPSLSAPSLSASRLELASANDVASDPATPSSREPTAPRSPDDSVELSGEFAEPGRSPEPSFPAVSDLSELDGFELDGSEFEEPETSANDGGTTRAESERSPAISPAIAAPEVWRDRELSFAEGRFQQFHRFDRRIEIATDFAESKASDRQASNPPAPAEANLQIAQTEDAPADSNEPQVLVSEVVVRGLDGRPLDPALVDLVYDTIRTRPGRTTTTSQLQRDVNEIDATGFFGRIQPLAEETPLGVRIVFEVLPNPVLNLVTADNNQVLTQAVLDDIFGDQYGEILNLRDFKAGVEAVNEWYQNNGYVLAQVLEPPVPEEGLPDPPPVSEDGVVNLEVAEGEIEDIEIRFLSEDGEPFDEEGDPIDGRTREFIITREMRLQPGDVLNRDIIQRDLQRIFGLGLFEDVNLSVEPGTDPRQAVLVINVIEGSFGSLAAGGGFSSVGGFFGTVSFQEQNLGGNDQILGTEIQLGTRGLFFDVNFTDPWIGGDPFRTAYNVNLFRRRSISLVFDSGPDQPEVELDNGDRPRIDRIGASVTFTRPLTRDVFGSRRAWTTSLGLEVQEVTIRDSDGDREPFDEEGNLLSAGEDGSDFIASLRFGIARDRRNSLLDPTDGYRISFSTEQTLPLSNDIFYNRLRGSYSYYFPIEILSLNEGPEALAFNIQAGSIIGDMPPYEAFVLGGVNSVRGYAEGALGAGRSFVQATAEYRFPIISVLGGVVFLDVGTDLGTGEDVPGDPAGVRDKPGSGFGYGVGLRIQSPIGPIRVDFGINDDGDNRFHFGIGQRF